MSSYTITVLETGGIQRFIFNSNALKENIGGSEIVYRATTIWVFEMLNKNERHNINITDKTAGQFNYTAAHIGENGCTAEVIYAGGGNTVILFGGEDSQDRAKAFVYELSNALLTRAPGLRLYAAHQSFEWGNERLLDALREARTKLSGVKSRATVPSPLLGLGVTAACTSTGLPATGTYVENNEPTLASAETLAKRKGTPEMATARLAAQLALETWPDDLDEIGRDKDGEDSYIAIVHADGNGMGQRFAALGKTFADETLEGTIAEQSRAYILATRYLSQKVGQTARTALKNTITALQKELGLGENDTLPFRPIVFGGDDITVVCRGNYGLAFAARYLEEIEQTELPFWNAEAANKLIEALDTADLDTICPQTKQYAGAGIAIVKTHYPFAQAYAMAEELMDSAKDRTKELFQKKASALDWHYTTTGISGDLDEIRKRELTIANGLKLYARPLLLNQPPDDVKTWRTWKNFQTAQHQFHNKWLESRNKVLALREALHGGPVAVAQFVGIERKGGELPTFSGVNELTGVENMGWPSEKVVDAKHCVYFDAIEMIDQFDFK